MTASILSSRRKVRNFGPVGSDPSALGRNAIIRKDETVEELSGTDKAEMRPYNVFLIEPPGSGYGRAD